MATRFYTDPTNTPSVSPAFSPTWDDDTQAVRRKLVLDAAGNNDSVSFGVTGTGSVPNGILAVQFVSEPLDAITGIAVDAWKSAFRCLESNAKANATFRFLIRGFSGDGGTARWSLVDTEDTEFDSSVLTNRYHSVSMGQNMSLEQGDRLVLEVGVIFAIAKEDPYDGTINVTDNHATTDLPENDTETTAYNSWIETGDTFTEASGEAGWAGKVSGVASADISKIMGVAIADIAKVGGV